VNDESRPIAFWKARLLLQADRPLGPMQLRCGEKVDVQGIVVVEVDRIVQLRVFFESAPGAAPESLILRAKGFPGPRR
jgi:hypothetical protein